MQKGQLGTDIRERVIFVWEGAVASLPDTYTIQTLERYKRRLHLWDQALGYWGIHPWALNMMWALLSRTPYRIDMAVTTREAEFAQALTKRIERENWPVSYVFAEPATTLGRRLSSMPDVKRVYYGVEEQRFAYGPQAHFVGPKTGLVVA